MIILVSLLYFLCNQVSVPIRIVRFALDCESLDSFGAWTVSHATKNAETSSSLRRLINELTSAEIMLFFIGNCLVHIDYYSQTRRQASLRPKNMPCRYRPVSPFSAPSLPFPSYRVCNFPMEFCDREIARESGILGNREIVIYLF